MTWAILGMAWPVTLTAAPTGSITSPTFATVVATLAAVPALPADAILSGPAPRVSPLKTTVAAARDGFSSHMSQATKPFANSLAYPLLAWVKSVAKTPVGFWPPDSMRYVSAPTTARTRPSQAWPALSEPWNPARVARPSTVPQTLSTMIPSQKKLLA
ncbi:hypothetical protein SVIOM74S_08242 [Streptomyces violarus]